MTTKQALAKAVRTVLDQGKWPEYRTQDDNGLEADEYVDFITEVLAALRSAQQAEAGNGGRWQHKKRGTTYELLGNAIIQTETPLSDMDPVLVYRAEKDGTLWVRPGHEFLDGRFEKLPSAPVVGAGVREKLEKLIQRHASAYVARGAAISDSIIAECKASREALLSALADTVTETGGSGQAPPDAKAVSKAFDHWCWTKDGSPLGLLGPGAAARQAFQAGIDWALSLPVSSTDQDGGGK